MSRKFWKECGCGGVPECTRCGGTGKIRDREAEAIDADRWRDQMKDEKLERERERLP